MTFPIRGRQEPFSCEEEHTVLPTFVSRKLVVYYESLKRELKTKPIYEFRCDERLMPALSTFLKLAFKPVFDGKSRLKDTRLLALS